MNTPGDDTPQRLSERACWLRFFRACADLLPRISTFVVLLALLALGCLAGIVLYGRSGTLAHRLVYNSFWFNALLGLLFLNLFACTLRSGGFRKRRPGMVVTHLGIGIIILAASFNNMTSYEGSIRLHRGQSAEAARDFQNPQASPVPLGFRLELVNFEIERHRPKRAIQVYHEKGEGTFLLSSFQRKRVQSVPHSNQTVALVSATTREALGPKLTRGDGSTGPGLRLLADDWNRPMVLGAGLGTGQLMPGGVFAVLAPEVDRLAATLDLAWSNLPVPCLEVQVNGRDEPVRFPLAGRKSYAVPGTETTITMIRYFPDFHMTGPGTVQSRSDEPNNPALELRIDMPGREPFPFWCFARMPNFKNRESPTGMEIAFRHPGPVRGVLALALTGEGRGRWRFRDRSEKESNGTFASGAPLAPEVTESTLEILEAFLSARVDDSPSLSPQMVAEVKTKGAAETLHRLVLDGPVQTASLEGMTFQLAYRTLPPAVKCYRSRVRVHRTEGGEESRAIEVNKPLRLGGWSIHQSSFDKDEHGTATILTATRNPGVPYVFLGFAMVCLGTGIASVHAMIRQRAADET